MRAGFRNTMSLLAALALAAPSVGRSQTEPAGSFRGSAASVGAVFTTTTGATGATGGLAIRLAGMAPRRVGFEVGLGYLASSATNPVFRSYSAAFAELGALYAVPLGSTALLARAGGSFLLNSNGGGDLAPYAGLGLVKPVSDRLGVRFDLMGRYWFEGPGFGMGAEAGLVWLLSSRGTKTETGAAAPPAGRPSPAGHPDGWSFGGSANLLATSIGDFESMFGPSIHAARLAPGRLGFETALTYVTPAGNYDFTGLALDLGLAYGQPVGNRPLLLFRGGLTLLAGGDSDGGGGAAAALTPGLGLVVPVAGRLGLRLDLSPRFWLTESSVVTMGASAGLVLLPR